MEDSLRSTLPAMLVSSPRTLASLASVSRGFRQSTRAAILSFFGRDPQDPRDEHGHRAAHPAIESYLRSRYQRDTLYRLDAVPTENIGLWRLVALLEKTCIFCRKPYRGSIRMWGMPAHDACLRSRELNTYYVKGVMGGVTIEPLLQIMPTNRRSGYSHHGQGRYDYDTVLKGVFAGTVPAHWTLRTIAQSEHPRVKQVKENMLMRSNDIRTDTRIREMEALKQERKRKAEEARRLRRKRRRLGAREQLDALAEMVGEVSWLVLARQLNKCVRDSLWLCAVSNTLHPLGSICASTRHAVFYKDKVPGHAHQYAFCPRYPEETRARYAFCCVHGRANVFSTAASAAECEAWLARRETMLMLRHDTREQERMSHRVRVYQPPSYFSKY